ncbi:BnaA09g16020D [Brassica napus]|uniref:BnaA09g16020D protein n=1 Tax=Brassica napus TaxID=3708 RepID=A0A078CGS0_BRANA|nr:BnaA09g16020D [Brassica napus]
MYVALLLLGWMVPTVQLI